MSIRVRFAPSPTGHLHIGSLRAAIFNWLLARAKGGQYLVRIEDTDVLRSKKEYVDSIKHSLEWMGLMPDEEIVFQMDRIDEHKKAIEKLLSKGLAYPCFCEPKERGAISKYPGTCRNKVFDKEDLKKPHAIRFKLPDGDKVTFKDLIRGDITVDFEQLDDFVIMRRDGIPTYNFVVVVDDMHMKITHVIRGEDHISNTPKQILMYQALEGKVPEFAHLPLILGKSGAKLSKRDVATSAVEYKDAGYLADALFNYLVRLGWSHGDQEVFSREELVKLFSINAVGKSGAIFDTKKLDWLNGIYIRGLNLTRFLEAISPAYETSLREAWGDKVEVFFELYRERATSLISLVEDILKLSVDPGELNIDLISKWRTDKTHLLVQDYMERLYLVEHLDHDILLNMAKDICEEYGAKLVELAQALRLSLCGSVQSPGVFDIIVALGKEASLNRMKHLLEEFRKNESEHIVTGEI